MPSANIDSFIDIIQGGLRPNQFYINVDFPGLEFSDRNTILCKSGSLPESSIGTVTIPYRGREIKVAGDRTYSTWSTTFISDRKMEIRSRFEKWNNAMNTHKDISAPYSVLAEEGLKFSYGRSVYIAQLAKNSNTDGSLVKLYVLRHAFPATVGSIELAYDNNNTYTEFSVDFEYSYFDSNDIYLTAGEFRLIREGERASGFAGLLENITTGDIGTLQVQLENAIQNRTLNR